MAFPAWPADDNHVAVTFKPEADLKGGSRLRPGWKRHLGDSLNRRVVVIGALASLTMVVSWYVLLWVPRGRAMHQSRERRKTAEQDQTQLRSDISRLRAEQSKAASARARVETLRTAIPDEPNLAQFILDANDAAGRSGIDFISIAPQLSTSSVGATADPPRPPPSPGQASGPPGRLR